MHRLLLLLSLCLCFSLHTYAHDFALKTSALGWLTTTTNLAAEVSVAPRWTLELNGAYNPWTFKEDKKMRFWLVQPQAKYWFCEAFEGHFVGLHAHGAQFYGGFRDKLYDGYLAGAGLSYGYDWILSPHWNLEAEVGLGYAHLWFKESPNIRCIKDRVDREKDYFGLTRLALTFTYLF